MKLTIAAFGLGAVILATPLAAQLPSRSGQDRPQPERPEETANGGQLKPSGAALKADRRAANRCQRQRLRQRPGQGRCRAGGREDQGGPLHHRPALPQGRSRREGQCRPGASNRCRGGVGPHRRWQDRDALPGPRRDLLRGQAVRPSRDCSREGNRRQPARSRNADHRWPRRATRRAARPTLSRCSSAPSRSPPPPARSRARKFTAARLALPTRDNCRSRRNWGGNGWRPIPALRAGAMRSPSIATSTKPDVQGTLDLLRLMQTAGALNSADDYSLFAEAAAERSNFAEAQSVLDAGIAANKVESQRPVSARSRCRP